MATCILTNLLGTCPSPSFLGGIKDILLINSADVLSYTYSTAAPTQGTVTGMTLAAGTGFRRFVPTKNTTSAKISRKQNKSKTGGIFEFEVMGEFHEVGMANNNWFDQFAKCCDGLTLVIRGNSRSVIVNNVAAAANTLNNPGTVYLTEEEDSVGADSSNPDDIWKTTFKISGASTRKWQEFTIAAPVVLP